MNDKDLLKFDWDIHHDCNYRCPYCWFYGKWHIEKRESLYLPMVEWVKHWDRVYEKYGTVCISINGGEPSIYPSFLDLVKALSEKHLVSFITNLSFDVEFFLATQISPSKIVLGLSFHPLQSDLESFLNKAKLLIKENYEITVYFVAYPPQMYMIKYLRDCFKEENICFRLMTFGESMKERNILIIIQEIRENK